MALNFMPYLNDPVSKPTGHEPFTTLVKKMVSGSTLSGKMPIVDEADYDATLGRAPVGPAASSTKIIPAATGPSTPIAEPALTNWNARHLPDLVSIAEDAGRRRAAEAYEKRFAGSKVGVATAPSLQFADQYYRQAQEALAKRQADLAAAGKTAEQWTSDPVWSSLNEAKNSAAHLYGKTIYQAEALGLGPALGMAGAIAKEYSPAMFGGGAAAAVPVAPGTEGRPGAQGMYSEEKARRALEMHPMVPHHAASWIRAARADILAGNRHAGKANNEIIDLLSAAYGGADPRSFGTYDATAGAWRLEPYAVTREGLHSLHTIASGMAGAHASVWKEAHSRPGQGLNRTKLEAIASNSTENPDKASMARRFTKMWET